MNDRRSLSPDTTTDALPTDADPALDENGLPYTVFADGLGDVTLFDLLDREYELGLWNRPGYGIYGYHDDNDDEYNTYDDDDDDDDADIEYDDTQPVIVHLARPYTGTDADADIPTYMHRYILPFSEYETSLKERPVPYWKILTESGYLITMCIVAMIALIILVLGKVL